MKLNSLSFIMNNKKAIGYTLIALIIIRFLYLNYINWTYGALSTGIPGVQYWLDSDRYLFGAENLLNGSHITTRGNQYMGYIIFIASFKFLGLSIKVIPLIQICIALLSASALYDLSKSITKSRFSSIFAIGLYLLNSFICMWHMYIMTESLYTSFVIFSC